MKVSLDQQPAIAPTRLHEIASVNRPPSRGRSNHSASRSNAAITQLDGLDTSIRKRK
jgi:hypothetical protein